MSGPKGGAYRVVETAEQREAQLLRDAKARYARAESFWQEVLSRREVLVAVIGAAPACERPAAPSRGADSTAYFAAAEALENAVTTAGAALGAAREDAARHAHAARVEHIVEHLRTQRQTGEVTRPTRWEANRPGGQYPQPAEPAVDWERVDERIVRRVRELAHLDHDIPRVRQLIADIRESTSESRIALLLNEVDLIIDESRAAATQREATSAARADLVALRSRLDGLPGDAARALRSRIEQLIADAATVVPGDLVTAVEAALKHADEEVERRYVAGVMRRTLEQLGYFVGPEFTTVLSGANAAFARNGSSNYGVKVRLEPDSNRFSAQAVRSDAVITTAEEDTAAEREFCAALTTMIELARRDGVDLDLDIRTEPGAFAVQEVSETMLATRATARAAKRSEKRQSP